MRILALESSCDETALALLSTNKAGLRLIKDRVYSQINIHKKYGGVVPEVAARKHTENIIPLLDSSLNNLKNIDYLAITTGPGLITSLLLGITTAKTLAYLTKIPLVEVNHLEGHVYSNWLSNRELVKHDRKYFPSLVLIVSGGHTELILMTAHGQYFSLGQTLDDAVGEAFDKVAKLLNLGYPGGPIVSKLAEQGNPEAYNFPRPMLKDQNYNFSLAGLKTAVLYTLEKKQKVNSQDIKDICASFQQAVVETLVTKTLRATKEYNVKSVMIAGGVSANQALISSFKKQLNLPFFYPQLKYTGDNAAMIATAAYYKIKYKKAKILKNQAVLNLEAKANWQLTKNNI